MSEPIFDPTTEGIYQRLPDHFRRVDKDFQLKKFLSGIGSAQDEVNELIERFEFRPLDDGGLVGDTSDLVNPVTANEAWLPWLAQLLGVNLKTKVVDNSTRNEIINASNGYKAGTDGAIIAAVQTELVGTRSVKLKKRSTSTGPGGAWDMVIQTLQSETLFNILPSSIIIPSSPNNWSVESVPPGDIERISMRIDDDNIFYKRRALEFISVPQTSGIGSEPGDDDDGYGEDDFGVEAFGTGDGTETGATEFYLRTPFYFPLDGSDPLTTMCDVAYISGTNSNITVSAGIELYQYTGGNYISLNSVVASPESNLNIDEMDRFIGRSEAIATLATHGKFMVHLQNVGINAVIHLGHFGARKETNTSWVPRTADPIQAVIDRGAKPAGLKLWHSYSSSSWEQLENGGTTTWNDVENAGTWVDVEELDGS